MPIQILSNRYPFPLGYRRAVFASTYVPWNGFVSGNNSPQSAILGATLQIVTSGAPTDLSTLQIIGADGKLYVFQFVYNGTVQTLGIKIPLPASGASTAAQVMTQIASVLSLSGGFPITGPAVVYPWSYQSINATTSRLNASLSGFMGPSVAPANVAVTTISGNTTFGLTSGICPARVGSVGAFLPGV